MARIGYFLSSEEFSPREPVEQARMARDAGFRAVDLRPLPSVDGRAGPERLRLGHDRGVLAGGAPAWHHGRDLSDGAPAPGRGRPGRGRCGRADRRPVHARRRLRRSAQRACAGRTPAELHGCAPGHARRGRADHPGPVHRREAGPPRPFPHGRGRPALHPPARAAEDLRLRIRPAGRGAGRSDRRRLHLDVPGRRPRAHVPAERGAWRQAGPGRDEGVLEPGAQGGRAHREAAVGHRTDPG